jgi:membrane-associated protease RseP (regulator of RpoE activity)
MAAWICLAGTGFHSATALADDDAIVPPVTAPASPSASPPAFEPGEITIGEPLQVPFRKPDAVVPPPDVPAGSPTVEVPPMPRRFSSAESPSAAAPSSAAAGTGWLGITVDDSLVPGRLVVVEVAPQGPAATAGLEPQDLLLGLNGSPLRTSDEMAAILATISPGMTVKAAVGKGDRVEERTLVATKRPPAAAAPGWQGSDHAGSTVTTPPSPSFLPPPNAAPLAASPRVDELPPPALNASGSGSRGRTALGVRTIPVDAAVQARYRLPEASGAYVIGVVGDLPASKAGVPPGSVIVAIRNQPVRGPQELTRLVTSSPVGAPVPLQYVLPGGESREAEVVLQSLERPLEEALVGDDASSPATASGPQRAQRVVPNAVAPAAATSPSTLEEEIRLLRRQIERLERRLERLEPSLLR